MGNNNQESYEDLELDAYGEELYSDSYHSFAQVYDLFMNNVPYAKWADYVQSLLSEHGILDGLVLELGCGTGSITEILSSKGYDMIGVDNSEEMLEIAIEKRIESGQDILYLLQDMREFELYGTVRAIISICDSINYITDEEDLLQVFRLVNNYLDPGGMFIFDLNTIYKYKEILGENTIAENQEEGSFIWDNYFDEETGINEYDLAIFIPEGEDGLYRKYEETHYQKGYELETVKSLIEKAGLKFVAAYDAFTKEPPKADSERIYILAQEQQKALK